VARNTDSLHIWAAWGDAWGFVRPLGWRLAVATLLIERVESLEEGERNVSCYLLPSLLMAVIRAVNGCDR